MQAVHPAVQLVRVRLPAHFLGWAGHVEVSVEPAECHLNERNGDGIGSDRYHRI